MLLALFVAGGLTITARGGDDKSSGGSGVEVLTPNPFTSGGARWNIMAAYGAKLELGKTEAQATDYLAKLFKNVVVQDKSARESLHDFTGSKGDVLAEKGYRSVIDSLVDKQKYPDPPKLFDITEFGGWDPVMKKFFDPKDSVMQRIEKGLGCATSSPASAS